MKYNKAILSPGNAYEHLATIKGVRFTPREIDVIACLLSGKGTKTVAQFLSIEEKTVETHKYNIMRKLECNAKEGVIHFVEKSDKFSALKKHYLGLLSQVLFAKKIQEILDLTGKIGGECSIVYWQEQEQKTPLVNPLEKYLKLAGFKVSLEVRENYKSLNHLVHNLESQTIDYIIYIVPQTLLGQLEADDNKRKLETFPFIQKASQCPGSVVFFLCNRDTATALPSEMQEIEYVDWEEQDNYYFAVLKILQKIMPDRNFGKLVADFRKQYETIHESMEKTSPQIWSEIIEIPAEGSVSLSLFFHLSKTRKAGLFLGATLFLSAFYLLFYTLTYQSTEHQELGVVLSDLPIPADSTLLKRSRILAQIEEKLKGEGGIQTVALTGIGGAGKTTIARQYAHDKKCSVIWEINAETKESLIGSFESLAYALSQTEEEKRMLKGLQDIKSPAEREEKIILFLKQRLKLRSNWFLVFDNIEKCGEIQKYLPSDPKVWGSGNIIITTRDNNITSNSHINNTLEIGELSLQEKFNLFMKITGRGDTPPFTTVQKEKVENFLDHIPPFPLDVSIAGYYLKATNISYERYLEYLNDYNKYFVNVQESILNEVGDYTKTRYNIINLSMKRLIEKDKNFEVLLLLISLLDTQNIPRSLLEIYKNNVIIDDFMYNLKKYSLIATQYSPPFHSTLTFSIHRSTQQIVLDILTKTLGLKKNTQFLQSISNGLERYMEVIINDFIDRDGFSEMKYLAPHYEKFLSHDNLLNNKIKKSIEGELGYIYFYLGYYMKAKHFFEQQLLNLNNNPNKNSIKIARILTYLGDVYEKLGAYNQAKALLEQSLVIYKNYLPEHHIYNAWALSLLGKIHTRLGNYEKAKELLEKGLIIYKKHLPKDHVYNGWILAHLGCVYKEIGSYEVAKNLFEKSLAIYEKKFGISHVATAWLLRDLGQVYFLQNQLGLSENFLSRALEIFQRDNHSESYTVLESLADLYLKKSIQVRDKGEIYHIQAFKKQAIGCLKQALEVVKAHFSESSPHITRVQSKLKTLAM